MSGDPAPDRVTCHVVTHVHWDREWYRPFESFRARLVHLVEDVCDQLDDGRTERFHLDGQTATVADVVEVRPDLEARVAGHVRAGRLTTGPWHVLADNQLVSAETLVRNLEAGARWVHRLGGSTGVGYSPDAFGHPADLPRVLAGFGSASALVWRGAPGAARFRWRSPDGSEVLTVNQGYHEAQVLWRDTDPVADRGTLASGGVPVDGATWAGGGIVGAAGERWGDIALRRLAAFIERERARVPDGPLLLLDGGDHVLPMDSTQRLATVAPAALDRLGVHLVGSDLDSFVAALGDGLDLPLVEGGLRHHGGWLTFLLPGTLSTRTWLKQANDAAQAVLERQVEPMLARRALAGVLTRTERAQLDRAWELVLLNAPHDSVCGCSVDEVHRENRSRAERVQQVAAELALRAGLAEGLDTRLHGSPPDTDVELVVRNPHARVHTGPVELEVVLAPGCRPFGLVAPDGSNTPVEVTDSASAGAWPLHFEADVDLLPDSHPVDRYTVAFLAREVPSLGWSVYRLRVDRGSHDPGDVLRPRYEDPGEEVVRVADGRGLGIADDASVRVVVAGVERAGLLRLVDDGDRGDSYTHDPVPDPPVGAQVLSRAAASSPVRTTVAAEAVLRVPTGLTADRARRSEATVDCPVQVVATAWAGVPGVQVQIRLDNRATDHRVRALTRAPSAVTWHGLSHWSVLGHPFGPEHGPLPNRPGHEAPSAVVPVHGLFFAGEGHDATAVLARGLPEAAGLADDSVAGPGPALSVTLLRAVGWLSRPDLKARTAAAGPMIATPECQVPGPFQADLVVLVGDETQAPLPVGMWPADLQPVAALVLAAQAHRVPMSVHQLRGGVRAPSVRGPAVVNPGAAEHDTSHAGLPSVVGALLSAFVPAGEGRGALLRIWNPSAIATAASVRLPAGVRAEVVRMDGTPTNEIVDVAKDCARLSLGPWQTTTLALRKEDGSPSPADRSSTRGSVFTRR